MIITSSLEHEEQTESRLEDNTQGKETDLTL